jgi:hypothetical protein
MSESLFLEYAGMVDYKMIDRILKKFKSNRDFLKLNKPTSKRVYSILVECLENIAKHSVKHSPLRKHVPDPKITVIKSGNKIIIESGNAVTIENKNDLISRIDQINLIDETALYRLYEQKINKELNQEETGAGLGFMVMKLKSGNRIIYNFTPDENGLLFFELKITVNEYIMRKLIIDPTSNSPKVIFDPDKNRFEISGESRPPDVTVFYGEILRWLDDYTLLLDKSQPGSDPLEFNLDFEYFNSSSAKYILDFCKQIGKVRAKGKEVTVKWHYENDDIDMLEVGKEMSRMSRFPFEYIQKDFK